jgi:hypothetical protein
VLGEGHVPDVGGGKADDHAGAVWAVLVSSPVDERDKYTRPSIGDYASTVTSGSAPASAAVAAKAGS